MSDLLLALARAPEGRLDEFNEWYDDEHAPARPKVPGILNAQRYVSVDDPMESLAYYDLESTSVLDSEDYVRLRSNRSEREAEMIEALPKLERRIYRGVEELGDDGYSPEAATHLLAVWMSVAPHQEDELADWYRREHAPELLKVDGWLRVRRFERVEGPGAKFLALHDLAGMHAFDDPQYQRARATPWRDRILEIRSEYERGVYQLHRRY